MTKYEGPIEDGMVFTAPDNDGNVFRRVRVVGHHIDGDLICEDLPSRYRGRHGEVFRCPEFNLRVVFKPEQAS